MNIYVDTVGCLKNFDDSDIAMGILEKSGHRIVDDPDDADVIIVNTCGFIEPAKRESIDEILGMASYREKGKKIIASGCLVQRYAAELYKEFPEVDGFIGVNEYDRLPELLESLSDGKRFSENKSYDPSEDVILDSKRPLHFGKNVYSRYIRISEGCDRSCTYCVIPKIRGPHRSRPIEDILSEARELSQNGCKELVVIAEDTGYYGYDLYGEPRLSVLLRELAKVDGIRWIRLMYCYEDNITDDLIKTIAEEPRICKYIDIPLQHISDHILRKMRRKTSKKGIEEKLRALRENIPGMTIRTTFITGFPGETEDDVQELEDFIQEQEFDRLGVFTYSREEGTPAYDMDGQIDEDVKTERRDRLMMKQLEISAKHNIELIGKELEVMVDSIDDDGSCVGRTEKDAPDIDDSVIFTPLKEHVPGDIVKVLIEEAFDYDLQGREINA